MATTFAPCVRVDQDARAGRRLIAVEDIPAGTCILSEPAVAAVLARARWESHCFGCWARLRPDARMRCGRCRLARYCDRRCQASDWKRAHAVECAALPLLDAHAEPDAQHAGFAHDCVLLGRAVRALSAAPAAVRAAVDALAAAPAEQAAHADGVARAALSHGLCAGGPPAPAALAARLARAFACNNFGVCSPSGAGGLLGAGLWPLGAVLNHSCAPNCALAHLLDARGAPPTQLVRTILPVRRGSELRHSYVDSSAGKAQRRAALRAPYGFECGCERCGGAPGGGGGREVGGCEAGREPEPAHAEPRADPALDAELDGPAEPHAADVARDLGAAASLHGRAVLAGAVAEERALLRAALELRARHLGPAHAHVRELRAALLACELAAGDVGAAAAEAERLLAGAERALGAAPSRARATLLLTAAEVWALCAAACAAGEGHGVSLGALRDAAAVAERAHARGRGAVAPRVPPGDAAAADEPARAWQGYAHARASACAERAVAQLLITHGEAHPLTAEARAALDAYSSSVAAAACA